MNVRSQNADVDRELAIIRRAFAKQILALAGVQEPRIQAAFAETKREQFLGAGPWQIYRWWLNGYIDKPDDDLVYLYTNDVTAIDAVRKINNGEPAFHATLLAAAMPQPGDHAVHIGAGAGYYTAILVHLVGPTRRVTGCRHHWFVSIPSAFNVQCQAPPRETSTNSSACKNAAKK